MDLYPDILICQNVFKKQGIIDILLSKLSLHAFKNASKTIVLGRCMQEKLVDKGIDVEQIQIIPNWAFEICPVEPKNNIFIRTNNLDGKFIVLYSGNMGVAHKFGTLLRAAQNLISYEEIIFIFVGDGVRKQEIYCQSLVQKNILMLNYQDPELLPHSLSSGDVHFISLDPCFSGVMVPSKLYGSLATGKPIIYEGSDSDEAALVIQEHQCGEIVKPGDADNLLTVILSYFNCREKRSLHGKNALYASEKVFFSKKVTKSYIDCISEVVNS
jgi:glycosyltransferase involved in cell wall biosynthesis